MIRLSPAQTRTRWFKHGYSEMAITDVSKTEMEKMVLVYRETGDPCHRQQCVGASIPVIEQMVGRFLFHYPCSRKYKDDLMSEGVLMAFKLIDELQLDKLNNFKAVLANSLRRRIEEYLNEMENIIHAPLSTNYSRLADGREPEGHKGRSLPDGL